jgi:hypothetical protein
MVRVPGMWLSEHSRIMCRSGLGRHGLIWNCECEATKAGYIFNGPFVMSSALESTRSLLYCTHQALSKSRGLTFGEVC